MKETKHMEYIFKTNDLCKYYGKFKALDGVNMSIPKGSIYGFVGKNGAGKTTLMRLMCGLQSPTSGEYILFDKKNTDPELAGVRKRMGAVVETPAIYKDLSAYDNLKLQCLNVGMPNFDDIPNLLKLVGLENVGKKKAKAFSLGMRQRLGIAIALCVHPDFLVLDEPTNGLDPQGIIEMRELILKLNKENGVTVLISSHILDELAKLATHYGFIDNGKIIREMSAAELEQECRKRICMKVDDTKVLAGIMDARGVDYKIIDEKNAEVFATFNFSDLASEFAKEGCSIISMEERDESLEAFFISLVGGEIHG